MEEGGSRILQHPFIARSPSRSCSAARRARSRSSTAPWRRRSGLGLRLWLAGLLLWMLGHVAAVWAAKRDPPSSTWCAAICASPAISSV